MHHSALTKADNNNVDEPFPIHEPSDFEDTFPKRTVRCEWDAVEFDEEDSLENVSSLDGEIPPPPTDLGRKDDDGETIASRTRSKVKKIVASVHFSEQDYYLDW